MFSDGDSEEDSDHKQSPKTAQSTSVDTPLNNDGFEGTVRDFNYLNTLQHETIDEYQYSSTDDSSSSEDLPTYVNDFAARTPDPDVAQSIEESNEPPETGRAVTQSDTPTTETSDHTESSTRTDRELSVSSNEALARDLQAHVDHAGVIFLQELQRIFQDEMKTTYAEPSNRRASLMPDDDTIRYLVRLFRACSYFTSEGGGGPEDIELSMGNWANIIQSESRQYENAWEVGHAFRNAGIMIIHEWDPLDLDLEE